MKKVTVLIPTIDRMVSLATTMTSLYFQNYKDFDLIVSDQSAENIMNDPSILTLIRLLKVQGNNVSFIRHFPKKGIAEQRSFLLTQVQTPFCLFLDDDLILESFCLEGMVKVIEEENLGFVGRAAIGLSFLQNIRPDEQKVEWWGKRVGREKIRPNTREWNRYRLHNAANLFHLEKGLGINYPTQKKYKVAWIGACVLYDTEKLKEVGGFEFWKDLPVDLCGEEVVAQIKLMEKFGGCGLIPSGVYHQELPTKLVNRTVNAPEIIFSDN